MPTTLRSARLERQVAVGEVIERHSGEIIGRWVERSKEEQPKARRVHHDVLLDHMPQFLTRLGRSLTMAGDDSDGIIREAEEHGDQRWDNGWSITEVVRDYQILRAVVIESLDEKLSRHLESREMLVLNVAIDDAIAAAVTAFVTSQGTPGLSVATTPNDARDVLLNALGVVGHEIRNPLAPLANGLEILRTAAGDATLVEKTRAMMDRQLQVLSRLVEDLMDLPRLARGKMSLVRRRLDLTKLVRNCAEDRRASLNAGGLSLTVDVPDDPVWIDGDEARLTQAISNILANAQKYTDHGGAVAVRMHASAAPRVAVVMSDTGVGIDPAHLPRVFEAYTQSQDTAGRSRGGLGLGLALVKGVVELHRGTVSVLSDGPGTGTTITMELPRVDASATTSKTNASEASPTMSRKVLIVEDNSDSALTLKLFLELHGHVVEVANNGADAIRIAGSLEPEVVVCDVGLPGKDGYSTAAELRKLPKVPRMIIALSGHGPRLDAQGVPDKAFDYYMLKPADPERLARLLGADSLA